MVVATFKQHDDALRAVQALRSAGISEKQIVVTRKEPGLLEGLLPQEQRSGNTSIEVRGKQSQAVASRLLRESGAEDAGGLKQVERSSEIASAKAEIEAAATDMNETIRAIQDRLNPEAVKARAKHALKEATVGRVERTIGGVNERISGGGGGVMDRIKQNPMPAALAGIGLTWLFMSKRTSKAYRPGYYQEMSYQRAYPYGTRAQSSNQGGIGDRAGNVAQQVGGTIGDTAGQVTDTIGNTASQVTDTIGNTANQVGTAVGQTAGQVGDTVAGATDQVRFTAGQWATQAGQQAQRVQSSLSRTMEDNPLPVGLAVLGLGALVAALVPKTPAEDQLLGETRDRLADTAQQVTQKVGRVAEKAGAAAKQEAQTQNLA